MENKKLHHLSDLFKLALSSPHAYMWFATSGGFITGRPITHQEYNFAIFPDAPGEDLPEDETQQLLPIGDVTLWMSPKPRKFKTAMIDGALVAGYGMFEPSKTDET